MTSCPERRIPTQLETSEVAFASRMIVEAEGY